MWQRDDTKTCPLLWMRGTGARFLFSDVILMWALHEDLVDLANLVDLLLAPVAQPLPPAYIRWKVINIFDPESDSLNSRTDTFRPVLASARQIPLQLLIFSLPVERCYYRYS